MRLGWCIVTMLLGGPAMAAAPPAAPAPPACDKRDDAGELCHFRAADQALRDAGTKVRVVFMGDSITELWASANPALFTGGVVNRGIGGQRTWQMLLRFRQDVIDLQPRVVHILGGTNDLLGLSSAPSLASVEGNIASMAELARAHGIAVVLGAVPPFAADWYTLDKRARVLALNRWMASYAHQEHLGFADYHAILSDRAGALDAQKAVDGVHPNARGFAAMGVVWGGVK